MTMKETERANSPPLEHSTQFQEILTRIGEAARRLDMPPESLFVRAFLIRKQELQQRKLALLREQESLRAKAYTAATRLLIDDVSIKIERGYFPRLKAIEAEQATRQEKPL